jgi:transposase
MSEVLHTMSVTEINRLEMIQKVEAKAIKRKQASQMLDITIRQLIRLIKAYRREGACGLISKHRGKTSNRKHDDSFKHNVIDLVKTHYSDFGPTLAAEKLLERHQLEINKETLRQWMIEASLWHGKIRKATTLHQMRTRRSCFGELVQIDGSHHDWFEGRADKCCLLVFIDDATSRLLELRFEPCESAVGYFNAIRNYLKRYGRPIAFYSDKHGIFRVNIPEAKNGTGETQFGRAMKELGIEIICANTPQAKGRVEKANGTLQDRLIKELRLRNINDIATANAFLPEFIEAYNKRFAVTPANSTDIHRKEIPNEEILNLILSFQYQRILSKNLELSYNNVIYQIKIPGQGYGLRHAKIKVCDNQAGEIKLLYKNKILPYEIFDKKNQVVEVVNRKEINAKLDQFSKTDGQSIGYKPKPNHPWRQTYKHLNVNQDNKVA